MYCGRRTCAGIKTTASMNGDYSFYCKGYSGNTDWDRCGDGLYLKINQSPYLPVQCRSSSEGGDGSCTGNALANPSQGYVGRGGLKIDCSMYGMCRCGNG